MGEGHRRTTKGGITNMIYFKWQIETAVSARAFSAAQCPPGRDARISPTVLLKEEVSESTSKEPLVDIVAAQHSLKRLNSNTNSFGTGLKRINRS